MKACLCLCLFICAVSSPALAQWQLDGVALSTAVSDQNSPTIVSDGTGGAIVTWYDSRSGTADIYAQRVNASGVPQWTANGVALCTAGNNQYSPTIVSDGTGGAIVTWYDFRSVSGTADIYAQRVNASGAPQWTANGVALCTAGNNQNNPTIAADGTGGAIVTWYDFRSGSGTSHIYAQRVNASGAPQWTFDGIALCIAANSQYGPTILSDGSGGAIVTWNDFRSGDYDIYAQRVNASGAPQWAANGVALCIAGNTQLLPTIVSDGSGGAIVTWHDSRSGNYDIYAQRVNASGAPQWTANGVALSTAVQAQANPTIASDGSGGAIVIWSDARSGTNYDIYAQRVNASGAPQWTANGVALCTVANDQYGSTLVSDGSGGAIVTWNDFRSGNYDVYTQRVNASGAPQWTADGVALSTAAGDQDYPTIVSDGSGGAIVTWYDSRSGSYDIYTQRVDGVYGYWGHPEPIVTSVADIPNDQGSKVAVNWTASGRDRPVPATIDFYSIWRSVDFAASNAVAGDQVVVTPIEAIGPDSAPGVRTTLSTSPYYWELVGTQTAYRWEKYSFSASTRADSVAGDPGTEFFMVAAHSLTDEHIAFPSNTMSGHSVDNLAPAAPLYLTAQRSGADVNLRWNRVRVPDLHDYAVYRATSAGVTAVPINFLSSSDDTVLVDANAPPTALHYIVTAYDVHKNESDPSNEASVSGTTSVGHTPAISALTVLQNYPNPFTGSADLEIGLPAASDVEIGVYDVVGREVRREQRGRMNAGWQRVALSDRGNDGKPLASGVYFYRVTAGGRTVTKKMVIAR